MYQSITKKPAKALLLQSMQLLLLVVLIFLQPGLAVYAQPISARQNGSTTKNATIHVVPKRYEASVKIQEATGSILHLLKDLPSGIRKPLVVKVPNSNYADILKELQNRDAKFLLPGAQIPSSAKTVFELESEQEDMLQTVYFI